MSRLVLLLPPSPCSLCVPPLFSVRVPTCSLPRTQHSSDYVLMFFVMWLLVATLFVCVFVCVHVRVCECVCVFSAYPPPFYWLDNCIPTPPRHMHRNKRFTFTHTKTHPQTSTTPLSFRERRVSPKGTRLCNHLHFQFLVALRKVIMSESHLCQ